MPSAGDVRTDDGRLPEPRKGDCTGVCVRGAGVGAPHRSLRCAGVNPSDLPPLAFFASRA
jgi:hypothetical protein